MSRLGNLKLFRSVKSWAIYLIIFSCIAKGITYILMVGYVPSSSMENTMQIGESFLGISIWFLDDLHRGDIVDFYPNKEEQDKADGYWVKRIIGIPGDKVKIEEGIIYINGKKQKESYVEKPISYNNSFTVPQGKYFVCGDNRAESWDARRWVNPFVSKEQIKYKVLFRVYPFNKIEYIYAKKSIAED